MKDFAARFDAPLTTSRPRGARQLEARSPKLGRRLRLFGCSITSLSRSGSASKPIRRS